MAMEGGSSGSASAIRAGKAVVEIGGDNSPLAAALAKAKSMIQGLGNGIKNIGVGLAAAGGSILAPLSGALKGEIDHIKELSKVSLILGEPIEKVSELAYAFKKAGLDTEEFGHLMNHLQRSLSEHADKPGGESVFARIGLDAEKLLKMPIEEQLNAIAEQWQKIPIAADKARVGQEIFGKQGMAILPMLSKGPEQLAKNMAEASAMGAIVTQEMAAQTKEGTQALKSMKLAAEYAFLALGGAVLGPATEWMATYGRTVTSVAQTVRRWIEDHRDLVQIVGGVGVGLLAAGTALMVIGKGVSLMGAGFGPIFKILSAGAGMVKGVLVGGFSLAVVALKGLLAATLALATPIGLVTALIVGLGAAWLTQTKSGQRFAKENGELFGAFVGEVKAGLAVLLEDGKAAWGGIVAAVKAGDLEGAASIAFAFLQLEWARLTEYLTRGWIRFKDKFLDVLHEMQLSVARWIADPAFARLFSGLASMEETIGLDESAAADRNVAEELRRDGGKDLQKALTQMEAEGARNRKKIRDQEMADAIAATRAAQAELARLIDKARNPSGNIEVAPMPRLMHSLAAGGKVAARAAIADSSAGGFNVASGQFNFGDKVGLRDLIDNGKEANVKLDAIRKVLEKTPLVKFK
jgi:hypothetical protein